MRTCMTIGAALGCLFGLAAACNGGAGQIGAPCETNDDCESGLVCDEHDGQASCQEPHDHGDEDTGASTGPANGSESGVTGDAGTETGHAHDSGDASTGPAHDSGDASTGHAHDSGDTTTGAAVECEAFCGCMSANCSGYAAYPYADEAACLDACASLTPEVLACYAGFCADAEVEPSPGLAEHWCEHAWGELGTDEC